VRAPSRLGISTAAKMPMMAMTIRSSIKVKPFCRMSFFLLSRPPLVGGKD
jgi:hypothetical protein